MNAGLPLVSVIVPSYNHERFVRQTIESILNQSYKNIELFVVDDGSKDNSAILLEELSRKNGFYFERQENKGLILTLNKLLGMCKGQYITMIASDDIMVPDKIEKQVTYLEEHPDVGASFGNMLMINENGELLPWYYQRFKQFREVHFEDILSIRVILYSCTNMYRKKVFDKLGYYEQQYLLEDLYMHLKMTFHKYKITILPDLMAYYRVHKGNITKQYRFIYKEHMKLLNKYKGEKGYRKGALKLRLTYYMYTALGIIPRSLNPFKQ